MEKELSLPEYMAQLYDYHYWANQRILEAAAGLSDAQFFREHGHSWGSVHGVLLHMLNAEWIWLRRWQGESPREFPGSEQYPTLLALRQRWAGIEAEMLAFLAAQTPENLQCQVEYTTTKGETFRLELWQMMAHVANHGTHHRGELAAMFAAMSAPHPEEDWVHYFLFQSGQRAAEYAGIARFPV